MSVEASRLITVALNLGKPPSKQLEFEVGFSHIEGVLHEAVEIYG
jgi:hypothetical protein